MSIRTRYAPSPTGFPHLGNLRTAVFAYLLAKSQGGDFLVRLEDTDQTRLVEGSAEYILESLKWLGIVPDEGVVLDEGGNLAEKGEYGPYIQSKRLSKYQEAAQGLVEEGKAYRCFCTPERLDEMRQAQQAASKPPRYDRYCRALDSEESKRRSQSEKFVVRHAMPSEGEVSFEDAIRGEISFACADLDDCVLLKSDGFPTYQLANVVDDRAMRITHVVRGEEWISSTPKNLLLYRDFGWEAPTYAHLPLILGPDKGKLSKRHGAEPVLAYRDRGYLPETIVNVLAFLGWSPGTEEEFFTLDELAQRFSLDRVQKGAAVFNADRLDYVSGWYIRRLDPAKLTEYLKPYWLQAGLIDSTTDEAYVRTVAATIHERLKHFDETPALTWFFFKRPTVDEAMRQLIVPKKATLEETLDRLGEAVKVLEGVPKEKWDHDTLKDLLFAHVEQAGLKNAQVLWPIRAALTGEDKSPGAFEMLAALGKEESLVRLRALIS